jgi:hypothetical protein
MYEALGAHVVDGGQTLNPSTYELLAGIHAVAADEVLVLPNSPNVILAAERAAELSEKPVSVVPVRAQQAGLAALVAFDSSRSIEENAQSVWDAAQRIRTAAVASAARDDPQGRFRAGDALGYVDDELVAWGTPAETLAATARRATDGRELLTCIAGAGAPLARDEVEGLLPKGVELDYHAGGQSSWWWLLSAE